MLKKSQFFYFMLGLFIILVAGFFVWNLFVIPNNGFLTKVLSQADKISTQFFPASISTSNITLVTNSNQTASVPENLEDPSNIDNTVAPAPEDFQDQLDDIQEKLDIISVQVQELVAEQSPDNQMAKVDDKDKPADDKKDPDQKQDDNQINQVPTTVACTGQININTASAEDLNKITQVGPVTAQKIISSRPFYSLNDLLKVSGIGQVTLQKITEQGCAYVENGLVGGGSGGGGSGPAPIIYPKILISEVQISPINQRFVELYNPNNQEVDLTGWYLQRKTSDSWNSFVSSTNFQNKTIPANGYFLISRSDATADILLTDLVLTANNSLAFKSPDEKISDQIGFGDITDNQSIGRSLCEQDTDDDSADLQLDTPTPKTQNIVYIAPGMPTLSSIAITTPSAKLVYNVGDILDINGLVITGTYSDGTTQTETVTPADITGFDSSTPVTGQILTITVNSQTVTYTIDVNSIVTTSPPSITTYIISNSVISPNGDGILDTTSINLAFSEEVKADVDIVNSSGVKVRDLYNSAKVKNPDIKVWDGKDNCGAIVPNGIYTIKIVITDSAQNSITDTSETITVDNGEEAPSGDATVTSAVYAVSPLANGIGTITDVSFGTTKATFLNNLVFAAGALENTTSSSLGDPIASNDALVVTAQDGITTATYTINVTVQNNVATQLRIISSPQTITVGSTSGIFTVESQNSLNQLTNVSATSYVGLLSSSLTGSFFSASATTQKCGSILAKPSITIAKGSAHKSFCYQDSVPGTFTITVSDSAGVLSSDFQSVIITTSPSNL